MSENKFIAQLKGNTAPGSVLEIQDKGSKTSFANMPSGTSDAIVTYSDKRNNATAVLKGAMNWKVNGSTLSVANPAGDGSDYTGQTDVAGISDQQGNNLWINASYTVPADGLFLTKNTKWVLKLCGDNLIVNGGDTAEFTVLITAGNSTNITKKFFVGEQANQFCKELVIDFAESNTSTVKLEQGDTITLKLLSDIPNASARIYQGMTTLTLLQRAVDAENVISKAGSYEDVWEEINKKVNIDGSSIMSGPLKFRAGSFVGAIAGGLGDGISFYKLKSDNTIDSEVASLTKTNGFAPGTTNTMNIGSSSLKWKDAYIGRVITSVLNNGANINIPTTGGTLGLNDFSNITDSAKNISNWSSNVSNCITEIPQDIKLELNNGTLILKAGSKIHMADGNLETTTTTSADITRTSPYNGQYMIILYGNAIFSGFVDSCLSGAIANRPNSTAHNAGMYFATDENKIYVTSDSGATWKHAANMSMPLAIITVSGGAISSIDQVFNGLGYIGSTVFVLPGVKGLYPDGRNADGTLKSGAINVTGVKTYNISNTAVKAIRIGASGLWAYHGYIVSDTKPSVNFNMWYNPSENIMYDTGFGTPSKLNASIAGFVSYDGTRITYFAPKTAFHTVDYNDFADLSNEVNGLSNKDLSNLTSTGANIANWSSNVTNCITEIPQDINLTLSNGTLTLKAGSKVYVPNGAGVFDEITVPADRTLTSGATWQFMVLYNKTSGDFYRNTDMAHQYSGNTAPENPTNQTIWYDTANNLVKMYLNGAWTSDWSFPLALVTATGSISSIDQVFNGFGYIGSTVFALPGVKGLKPNGRNADGTLKSTVITKTNVSIGTYTGTSPIYFGISSSTSPVYFQSDTGYSYDPETNTTNWGVAILGHFRATAGVISNWKPKIAFHAVDYSDTEFIANQAMPSNKYLGLSLGATGTTYTAPGNGYFTVTKQAGASGEYIYIANNANGMNSGIMATGALNCRCFLPVSKGDSVQINYTLTGTTNTFRFVYANGAK